VDKSTAPVHQHCLHEARSAANRVAQAEETQENYEVGEVTLADFRCG
jgi:hypothetical protein